MFSIRARGNKPTALVPATRATRRAPHRRAPHRRAAATLALATLALLAGSLAACSSGSDEEVAPPTTATPTTATPTTTTPPTTTTIISITIPTTTTLVPTEFESLLPVIEVPVEIEVRELEPGELDDTGPGSVGAFITPAPPPDPDSPDLGRPHTFLPSPEVFVIEPDMLVPDIINSYPHDPDAFTQGLLRTPTGRIYEGTGLTQQSSLREISLSQAEPVRSILLSDIPTPLPENFDPEELFGEGLALVGDSTLVQLTWLSGLAFVWDANTFHGTNTPTEIIDLGPNQNGEGKQQGWGLCYDGIRLVMSEGTDQLQFRHPETLELLGSVSVRLRGEEVANLNELECVDGKVWANVWLTNEIYQIDPGSGQVEAVVDASILASLAETACQRQGCQVDVLNRDVLNGIAYNPEHDVFLLTGKRWPRIYEVRFVSG